jgi:glyoxylase-like metal-dependent hydrolase (beta-lactamase superfamily II)/8-oxo-dGTP pyrophosphatase MutT (NUDIX family)
MTQAPTAPKAPATPKPASTVILLRDSLHGMEVLLILRAQDAKSFSGAYVFPGGVVDAEDHIANWPEFDADAEASANKMLGVEQGGFSYLLATIRECYEEAGLLLAERAGDASGELVDIETPEQIERFSKLREQLNAGTLSFRALMAQEQLRPAIGRLSYVSHWITPVAIPRRFDTRFFVALAPARQIGSHDQGETVDHAWVRPADALARQKAGEYKLFLPTVTTLKLLAQFSDCASFMQHLAQPRQVEPTRPHFAKGPEGQRILVGQDYAYAEAVKLDPESKGTTSCEITADVPVQLSARIRRVTAPNASYMTGPGTNSYLLGDGDEFAVIDPGPDIEDHVLHLIEQAKGASGNGRIRWILATHTHSDHSPATVRLKALTGAEVLGMPPPPHDRQDQTFKPDRILAHNERLVIAGCTLRVIHTPGHASNHLCYLFEEEKILFTGDHLMQGSTVVINPPDGDMEAYFVSLRNLKNEDIDYLAPGHGFLIDQHRRLIDALLVHRLKREEKVLTVLREFKRASLEDLVPKVYDDVPVQIHQVASRSLLAHLIKLQREGKAQEDNGRWLA